MPSTWAVSSASAMSMPRVTIVSVSRVRAAIKYFSVTPCKYSMAINRFPSCSDLIDRADIGMVQGRSRLGLSLEANQCLGISGYVIRQKFQRNESVQGEVFGFVDDTHASAAEFLENAVMRDDLVDHEETSVLGVSRLASSSRTRRSRSTHSCTVYLTEKYRLSISPN